MKFHMKFPMKIALPGFRKIQYGGVMGSQNDGSTDRQVQVFILRQAVNSPCGTITLSLKLLNVPDHGHLSDSEAVKSFPAERFNQPS